MFWSSGGKVAINVRLIQGLTFRFPFVSFQWRCVVFVFVRINFDAFGSQNLKRITQLKISGASQSTPNKSAKNTVFLGPVFRESETLASVFFPNVEHLRRQFIHKLFPNYLIFFILVAYKSSWKPVSFC